MYYLPIQKYAFFLLSNAFMIRGMFTRLSGRFFGYIFFFPTPFAK